MIFSLCKENLSLVPKGHILLKDLKAPSSPSLTKIQIVACYNARNMMPTTPQPQQPPPATSGGGWRQRLEGEVGLSLLWAAFSTGLVACGINPSWSHTHVCSLTETRCLCLPKNLVWNSYLYNWYILSIYMVYLQVHKDIPGIYMEYRAYTYVRIYHVYTWYIPGISSPSDIHGIYHVYILYIPCIYLFNVAGIYHVYTWYILKYIWNPLPLVYPCT
jgi:hypothetical protein